MYFLQMEKEFTELHLNTVEEDNALSYMMLLLTWLGEKFFVSQSYN